MECKLWRESGLLSAQDQTRDTNITLEAVQKPAEVAILHCRTHQADTEMGWTETF